MANNASNVSVAKPKIGGAIYRANLGTTLPTNATDTLDTDFKCLGYVSEDGLTNANSYDSTDIVSWDGVVVETSEGSKTDNFTFKLIESLNPDVLKAVYGDANVTGTLTDGITVQSNSATQLSKSWVVDMIMKNGVLKRIVIPDGKVTSVSDVVYKRDELVGYEITVSAVPDASNNTHYEYIEA